MSLSLFAPPADEPLTLEEAKAHCLIGSAITDQDALLEAFIPGVRERAEQATGRAMLIQTWDLVLDGFPREPYIELPKPPLVSVTSITYRDTGGVLRTWASTNYLVEAPAGPRCARGRISLPFAAIWPITLPQAGSVTARFVCGYGDAGDVPALLKVAMLLDVGTWYLNRESVLTGSREQAIELPLGSSAVYRAYHSPATQRLPYGGTR